MNAPATQGPMEPQQSGLGIASFVISIVSGFGSLMVFVYAGLKETTMPGGVSEHSTTAIAIGMTMMLMWLLLFVGTVLGAVALFEKNRKKVFAVIGLSFNLGMLLVSALLILIGITAAN